MHVHTSSTSPIGTTPTKKPTRKPTSGPTKEATDYPTYSQSITAKPTEKPTYDADDPSQTFFCGTSWDEANKTCGMRCPSGNSGNCPGKLECWAFTSCKEELGIQMNTTQPSPMVSPTLAVVYVPGYGGAQVPVFGGVNYTLMQPTSSPAPTGSGRPSVVPSLPPAVAARGKRATYFCGKDWVDVEANCHSACPSRSNAKCKDPEHICWAFVEACKATMSPIENSVTNKIPNLSPSPVTSQP